jgi:hypothetical protein
MSAASAVSARTIALSLERLKRSRGATVETARRAIARDIRTGFGTVNNIIRDRVKRVDEKIRDRLHARLVSELRSEIARLEHELAMAGGGPQPLAENQVREIEAHIAAARTLLSERGARLTR